MKGSPKGPRQKAKKENSKAVSRKSIAPDPAENEPVRKKAVSNFSEKVINTGPSRDRFYIVGMGGSAGALEAFEDFFRHMPANSGAAFVVVSHLDPTHKGVMPELIQRHTKMQVFEAEDGMKVGPNCVYVIPSNKDMGILHGTLQLLEPTASRGLRLPIDFFFKHLGQDRKDRAVGIIFSGMGTDGTAGLKTIKENSGMIMVQDPESAKFDSMPRSAIETGLADYIAGADTLPSKLLGYLKQIARPIAETVIAEERETSDLQKILIILRGQTGNDFSLYKKNTILRRIERRMNVHQIATTKEYVELLQANPHEVDLLFRELLIGVTSFFRDPGAFASLKDKVVPVILAGREKERTIRIWVPGCSTGEEAYSVAIILSECMRKLKPTVDYKVQIFATDIDKEAIEKARQGIYPANIAADLSRDRLERFFARQDSRYQINKNIREMVIFAPHNVTMDPPFTKLDLICCRNLLIYLTAELQKKLLAVFHYGLKPDGFLFLGTSESVGRYGDFFSPADIRWKIYQRRATLQPPVDAGDFALFYRDIAPGAVTKPHPVELVSIPETANRLLLENFTPAAVFVNEQGDIIYIHGRTGKYLEPPSGKANINIYAMARQGLAVELTGALREAKTRNTSVTLKDVRVKTNGDFQSIDLSIMPVSQPGLSHSVFMIVFSDRAMPPEEPLPEKGRGASYARLKAINAELEKELRRTRDLLQSTNEEMQLSQEELKSTNEELQSTNEELQSTNEELSSSKEEMQSLNEELMTVNVELQAKISEITLANDDMKNMLNRTEMATLFLDCDMKIRRYTPEATKIFNLIPGDIGRPISHIVSNLKYETINDDFRKVLETLVFKETEIETKDGHWHLMRVTPYRTHTDTIDGLVINFTDITTMKKMSETLEEKKSAAQQALCFAEAIIETLREPFVVLDNGMMVLSANRPFYETFAVDPDQTEGMLLFDLGNGQWDSPQLRKLLSDVRLRDESFHDFAVEHDFPSIGRKKILLNAHMIGRGDGEEGRILLAFEDVTGK
ncbi:MAG TPA: CheR family methyltransferase [Dissulfurispiraceae bacterium]|nr:CheR family methyltransferase [Dissulfurispiraceae bacterium]